MSKLDEHLKKINDDLALSKNQIESLRKTIGLLNQGQKKHDLEKRLKSEMDSFQRYQEIISNMKNESDLVDYEDKISELVREEENRLKDNLKILSKNIETLEEQTSQTSTKNADKPNH